MSTILQPGDLLEDRFAIVSRLGAGGTATVFLADDPSLERKVAVKVLHGKLTERSDLLARFRREAQALTKLDHPGILTVFRYGLLPDYAPYLVTEYIEGESLRKLLEGGPLTCAEAAAFGLQIADALAHAHAAGVIHRDVKPDNLMIEKSSFVGSQPRIKLLDFGLCKAENPLSAGEITVTAAGSAIGTPSYMSPEQCLGQPADPRTDIYAFGCIFFEMLTGAHVFVGETAGVIVLAHLNSPPPRLADIDSKTRMPPIAQQILDKCLAKNKAQRYASANELKTDLQVLANSGSTARLPGGGQLRPAVRTGGTGLSGSYQAKTNRRTALAIAAGTTALVLTFITALIVFTDGGNRLVLSEIEKHYPPKMAAPLLVDGITRIKTLRGSRAASLVAFDTSNSEYLRPWSIVDRLALDQHLIDIFHGESAAQFPLKVTMLEHALSTMARVPDRDKYENPDSARLHPANLPPAQDLEAASAAAALLADGFVKDQSLTPQNWKRLLDMAVQYRADRSPSSAGWAGLLRLYGEASLRVIGDKPDIDQTSDICRALIGYSAFYRGAPAGENGDCEQVLHQSLALAERNKHVKRAGWAHVELARFCLRHGRFAEARDHIIKAEKCDEIAGLSAAETDSLERAKALLAKHDTGI